MASVGTIVPSPPTGLKWPNYIICRSNHISRDFTVILSEIRDSSLVIYDVPYGGAVIEPIYKVFSMQVDVDFSKDKNEITIIL